MTLVAQQAAIGEGKIWPNRLPDLISGQFFCPTDSACGPDGSQLEFHRERARDYRFSFAARGVRLPAKRRMCNSLQVTAGEADRYQKVCRLVFNRSGRSSIRLLPACVARMERRPEQERVVLDVQLTPRWRRKNYETIANALGPIATEKLAPIPGDNRGSRSQL